MSWHEILLYLTSLAPLQSALLIVIVPSLIAACCTVIVRKKIGFDRLASNTELAGIKFGIVALTYIMILTFATLSAWEKFSFAQSAVTDEAAAAGAIYVITKDHTKEGDLLQRKIKLYLEQAILKEWPMMELENSDEETAQALRNLYRSASDLDKDSNATTQIAAELFKHIDKINDSRRIRITLSAGIIPDLVWFVLIIGAFITIGFTLFFATESLLAQVLMTGMTSVMLLMALLVIIAFDHPFTGVVHVSAAPLQKALDEMQE